MQPEGDDKGQPHLLPWEPLKLVRQRDPVETRYSRGFLRCRPEKWFPGFGMQWMPLGHSLGVELKLIEAKPVIGAPRGLAYGFAGSIDDEPIGMFVDLDSADTILDAVCPGALQSARTVVLEYLARRLLSSLAISWSGPESPIIQFEPDINPDNMREIGAVKFTGSVNGNPFVVWILIGKIMVERLDSLWRRQLHSTSKQATDPIDVHLEVAHLTVPPSILSDYMKSGQVIDLEVPVSDGLNLVVRGQAWLPARLCAVDGNLGIEIGAGPARQSTLPEGTTRLSIEFGKLSCEPGLATEMSQVGAIFDSGIPLSDSVQMVVNGEKVGEAILQTYEGRFAITVL